MAENSWTAGPAAVIAGMMRAQAEGTDEEVRALTDRACVGYLGADRRLGDAEDLRREVTRQRDEARGERDAWRTTMAFCVHVEFEVRRYYTTVREFVDSMVERIGRAPGKEKITANFVRMLKELGYTIAKAPGVGTLPDGGWQSMNSVIKHGGGVLAARDLAEGIAEDESDPEKQAALYQSRAEAKVKDTQRVRAETGMDLPVFAAGVHRPLEAMVLRRFRPGAPDERREAARLFERAIPEVLADPALMLDLAERLRVRGEQKGESAQ